MASLGLQILGVALSFVGLLGSIITCALPMWRVTAFIGNNIVTAQIIWEGLWMVCVVQSTGHMQCKVYDSMLALSTDLQAARALLVLSIVLSVFGILLAVDRTQYKCKPRCLRRWFERQPDTFTFVSSGQATYVNFTPPKWKYVNIRMFKSLTIHTTVSNHE
uniref:Claudin n=1 Tax=Cyprinus carpio TaxID=7962 RepID=A0A8C1VDT4_CYPCA